MKGKPHFVAILYADGREEKVKIGLGAIVASERRWKGRMMPVVESTAYGAWLGLGKPGIGSDEDSKFDDWLSSVDLVEDVVDEPEGSEDPTQPAL